MPVHRVSERNLDMSRHLPFTRTLLCVLISVFLTTCGFDEGPSLQVDVRDTVLVPTAGDAALCCCRVVGIIENLSTVPVHVTLQFKAYGTGENETSEEEVGTAVVFLERLEPAEQRQVDAPGLLLPCSNIERFELVDVDIRGVWFPPP